MSGQTDPLAAVIADAIDAQNDGGGEQFAINRETMTAEIECYRLDIAALAQAIRAGFPSKYAVETADFGGQLDYIGPCTSEADATELAKTYENARPVATPQIPWHPIKENNQHD